jgi:SAM-dependent methyltransferase
MLNELTANTDAHPAASMTDVQIRTNPAHLRPDAFKADPRLFGDTVDLNNHRIKFILPTIRGKDVLDLGCVDHDIERSKHRDWIHGALVQHAKSVVGLDLVEDGIKAMKERGYNVVYGDAQVFDLGRKFDAIVAGDLLIDLEDLYSFFTSCRKHLVRGGRLLITVPNPWFWRNPARALLKGKWCGNPEQTVWLCPTTAKQFGARHGFELRRQGYGSRQKLHVITPLPSIFKHTTFHLDFELVD